MNTSFPLISGGTIDTFISSFGFVLFFLLSTYGVGRLFTYFTYKGVKIGWAYTTTIGIAGWIIYGGVLNLLGIIYPNMLLISLIIGSISAISFSLQSIFRKKPVSSPSRRNAPYAALKNAISSEDFVYALILLSVLVFCVFYLMPSRSYNVHDDFNSYFYRSVKLLADGGFQSNIFSQFGYNSLGGHDFMKAFPLIFFDVSYSNTFDTIICFFLGLALTIEYAKKLNVNSSIAIIAAALFIFINPQIVNTSSVYSGSLLIIGLLLSSIYLQERSNNIETVTARYIIPSAIPVSLFYGALTTLKANLIIYGALFFLIKLLFELFFLKSKKVVIISNTVLLILGFAFVLPWLLSPSSKYFDVLYSKLSKLSAGSATSVIAEQADNTQHITNNLSPFFSTRDLFYGASLPDYLSVFFLLFGISLVCFLFAVRKLKGFPIGEALVIASATLVPILSLTIMAGMTDTPGTALRYNIPLTIATLPISLVFVAGRFPMLNHSLAKYSIRAFVGFSLIIIGMFSRSLIDRIERIVYQGHVVSFPVTRSYLYNANVVMSEPTRATIQKAQSTMENGTKVLAWIGTPFHLDFTKNVITIFGSPGRWAPNFPLNTDIETLWRYLRGHGFDYIYWQSHGFAVKGPRWYRGKSGGSVDRLRFLKKSIPSLADATELVYHSNGIWVLDIRVFNDTD